MHAMDNLVHALKQPRADAVIQRLYGPEQLSLQKQRYQRLLQDFVLSFPNPGEAAFFSTSGRTEVGGNHTDHNAGRVLAAAVDLDLLAVAGRTAGTRVEIHSAGYPAIQVDLAELPVRRAERGTPAALVRGVAWRLSELGYQVGGFQAVMTSSVPGGAGLSSSAAFEVQIGLILSELYNQGRADALTLAQAGQFAENEYFGKPCGLMDQATCATGGLVSFDFADGEHPQVHRVDYDFARSGYALVIVETGGSHADLTEDYAAIQKEMIAVARALGGQSLRQVSKAQVLEHAAELRRAVNDRAVLRALHYFNENQRVIEQAAALEAGDFERFLAIVNESGRSSWMLLQNGYSPRRPEQQGIPLALELTRELAGAGTLAGQPCAWRVHGGGFAGTMQAFLPVDALPGYVQAMEAVFGAGACHPVRVRPVGAVRVEFD